MRYFITIYTLLFLSIYINAEKPPITWGKITDIEKKMQTPPNDPEAPAVVLCDFEEINVSNRTFYKRHIRIKILKPEGIQYGSIEIPYRSKNKHDDITELKAQAYFFENGRMTTEKIGKDNIFDVKIDDDNQKKILTFPNLKPGSIIEFKYIIASLDFAELDQWYFQQEIPVLWSEIRFSCPEFFTYLVTFEKDSPLTDTEKKDYIGKLNWLILEKEKEAEKVLRNTNYVLYENPEKNFKVFVVKNRSRRIIMKGLPGYRNEPSKYDAQLSAPKVKFHLYLAAGNLSFIYKPLLMTTLDGYEYKSKSELAHTTISGYVHYRLESWSDMNTRLLESPNFGLQLIKFFNHKPIFKDIINEGDNDLEKIQAIYQFCRTKMKWNGNHTVYVPDGLTKPYNKGTGSSSEINMLMIYLLRKAGFDADPLLVRTRDLGYPETIYSVRNQFNNVIAAITLDDYIYLLDATSDENFGTLPLKDRNGKGFLVRKKDFGWISLDAAGKVTKATEGILTCIDR
ncbi:MAG: DUF3857 and transglutaminase domain-containing protein [Bacteroidales bacterium]|nr:DUF3857 and transglutaminase domain-containing protein [Bacteroidales bacterium]